MNECAIFVRHIRAIYVRRQQETTNGESLTQQVDQQTWACQKQFERLGIDLPRNTLASHMIKVGELINPLIEQLTQHMLGYDLIGMDETPV